MVIYRHRQDSLCHLLADPYSSNVADLLRRGQVRLGSCPLVGAGFLANDVVAQLNAFVTDEYRRPAINFLTSLLALAAEGTTSGAFHRFFGHLSLILASARLLNTLSTGPYFTASSADAGIAVGVARDGLRSVGMQGQHFVQPPAQVQNFLSVNFDVDACPDNRPWVDGS
jgi:hypothetical protein